MSSEPQYSHNSQWQNSRGPSLVHHQQGYTGMEHHGTSGTGHHTYHPFSKGQGMCLSIDSAIVSPTWVQHTWGLAIVHTSAAGTVSFCISTKSCRRTARALFRAGQVRVTLVRSSIKHFEVFTTSSVRSPQI